MARLRDVTNFEVRRTLRKKTFWYSAIAIPTIIIAVYSLSYASNHQAAKHADSQTIPSSAKMAAYDATGFVTPAVLKQKNVQSEPSQSAGIAAVKAGKLTAFFYYPKDVVSSGIYIYQQDQGLTNSPPYDALAQTILKTAAGEIALKSVHNSEVVVLLGTSPNVTTTTYKNGAETNGLATIIAPGLIGIVFMLLIVLLAYLMISATSEEKENRVAEIILTAIPGRTVILGKIVSIFVLAIVQLVVLTVPLVILYIKFKSQISLPGGISLGQIPINPTQIGIGLTALVFGIVMYTGILVGLGSMFPSAQDAGRFLGAVILSAFVPVYAIATIITDPGAKIVKVFTYFPLTSPTTVLLRNAIGSITVAQAVPALVILAACACLALVFAVKAFQVSALEYGRRVSLKEIWR